MESARSLDRFERRILTELQVDGRASHAELARRVGLSTTAVSDRVRELEASGVISGYAALVNPALVGLPIIAMVTMTCDGDRCRRLVSEIVDIPEIIECHRLTGDASALLKVAVASIGQLEMLVDRLAVFGKPSTAIVLSTPLDRRPLPTETREAVPDPRPRSQRR